MEGVNDEYGDSGISFDASKHWGYGCNCWIQDGKYGSWNDMYQDAVYDYVDNFSSEPKSYGHAVDATDRVCQEYRNCLKCVQDQFGFVCSLAPLCHSGENNFK